MGRPWRTEYQGGIYHVVARGNNKEYIFNEDIDKGYFVKQLKETIAGMNYRIYGYVLMDNHYHLLIQTMDKKLQKIMHQINNKYSKYFNAKYKRTGHVFQGRYKAILVQDERYLIGVLRYIHQNPVNAGICQKVDDYKWSSDIFYRSQLNSFVYTETILDMISKTRGEAIKLYADFMITSVEEDYENMKIIGDEAYKAMCLSRNKSVERKALDEILKDLGLSEVDFDLIKAASRKRSLSLYKLEYARQAFIIKYTYREIAENIGVTESSVKDMIYKHEKLTV